jgi:hypothetical protein
MVMALPRHHRSPLKGPEEAPSHPRLRGFFISAASGPDQFPRLITMARAAEVRQWCPATTFPWRTAFLTKAANWRRTSFGHVVVLNFSTTQKAKGAHRSERPARE